MMRDWTLFSNHGHVLVCLSRDNKARLRGVAQDVGITERAVQKIVRELQDAGFISISKHGRCNHYDINTRKSLRHALEAQCTVGRLMDVFSSPEKRSSRVTVEDTARAKASPEMPFEDKPSQEEALLPDKIKSKSTPIQPQSSRNKEEKASSESQEEMNTTTDPSDTREQGSLF